MATARRPPRTSRPAAPDTAQTPAGAQDAARAPDEPGTHNASTPDGPAAAAPEPAAQPAAGASTAPGYMIATRVLRVPGGAVAHRPGGQVPAGNVARNGWADGVRAPEPDGN